MTSISKRDSLTPARLLNCFEELSGEYSQPLLIKNRGETCAPPPLLPGETLIMQQDHVSCVGSLSCVANGVLHLTNYRIIFDGVYKESDVKNGNRFDPQDVAQHGYRFQKGKDRFLNAGHLKKFIGRSFRGDRMLPSSLRWKSKADLQRKYNLETDVSLIGCDHEFNACDLIRINPLFETKAADSSGPNAESHRQVCVSLPRLCIYDIHKFPKQYLRQEKLMMLRDGLEILSSNFLSLRFCLGATGGYDADEMILLLKQSKSKNILSVFAYMYGKAVRIPRSCEILKDRTALNFYKFADEAERLGLVFGDKWCAFGQSDCVRYPEQVILPSGITKRDDMWKLAVFYRNNCFPVVVWRNPCFGNVLLRSANTTAQRGVPGNRCEIDELLMSVISTAGHSNDKVFIYSDRYKPLPPSTNTLAGLSLHEGETFYYPNCSLVYFDLLPDILSVQRSALKLLDALSYKSDESHYLSIVEESGWLEQIQLLLEISKSVAMAMSEDYATVVIALEEGLDRAAQISSLSQLMLDPYYRTFDGFQVLVQKEWVHFKHPFIKRNMSYFSDSDEQSPIFLQFLDCVWQMTQQFPTSFQFGDGLLEALAEHSYSGRFGSFLEIRDSADVGPVSIWSWINVVGMNSSELYNYNYDESDNSGTVYPTPNIPWLNLWTWFSKLRREAHLQEAGVFGVMQLEKLQSKYKDACQRHERLLRDLSIADANSPSICNSPINSRTLTRFEFQPKPLALQRESSWGSYPESLSTLASEDGNVSPTTPKWAKNRAKSLDNITSLTATKTRRKSYYPKIGKSKFFMPPNHARAERSRHLSLPGEWRSNVKVTSLENYLHDEGLADDILDGIQVSSLTCRGYLVKRGSIHKAWRRRWFVLDITKRYAAYFESPTSEHPKGVIAFRLICDVYPHMKQHKHPNLFIVETLHRKYYIKAPSPPLMRVWVSCFNLPLASMGGTIGKDNPIAFKATLDVSSEMSPDDSFDEAD